MSSGADLGTSIRRGVVRVGWTANTAGAFVTFIAVGFFVPIFVDPDDRAALGVQNAPIVLAYLLLAGLAVTRSFDRHVARTLRWLAEERAPDEREHEQSLRLAAHGTKLNALGWLGAALIIGAINGALHSLGFAAVVAATIWLGGEMTCALLYLATERRLRPLTARTLAARDSSSNVAPGVRTRLAMAWLLGTGVPLLGVLVVGAVGVTTDDVASEYIAAAALFLGGVATAAGLLAIQFAAQAIAEPLTAVRSGLERIQRGEYGVHVPVDDGSEVGRLQDGFNRMAEGLRERERIRDMFGRQVGQDVAREALREGVRLGGEEREIGALFVDLTGSTGMALERPPTQVVELLNRFFHVVVEVVETAGGSVNKFEGDAALCVFGAPVAREDGAGDALRAARELTRRLGEEVPDIDFGIGVSAGTAVAGNVGAEQRFEYTVIGDPVNEAARLSDLAKDRPGRVLASDAALLRAAGAEAAAWDVAEAVVLRGRTAPTALAAPRTYAESGRSSEDR